MPYPILVFHPSRFAHHAHIVRANICRCCLPAVQDPAGIRNLLAQVGIDQFVHHPLMYFPVFYMIKDFVTSDSPNPAKAVSSYTVNMQEDLLALWKIWVPSTLINFAFMPMWGRIPWVASTSLIWTCILSAMRGGSDAVPEKNVFGQVDAQTFELVTRGALGPAPRLDPKRAHLLVTVTGFDRQGLVKDMSSIMYEQGASITTSKMMSLGEEFAMVMHIECDPAKVNSVQAAINDGKLRKEHGLDVGCRAVEPLSPEKKIVPKFVASISFTGVDRPGLLFRLSDVLTTQGLSIEHLQTEQHRSKRGQPHMFTTSCHVCSSVTPDRAALRKALKDLESELDVKIVFDVIDARLHRTVTG